jgi:tetratricopeptide (TPR) repeat protein
MRIAPTALLFLVCAAAAQKAGPADSAFSGAVSDLKQGHFADAEAGFRKVTDIEPDHVRGFLGVTQVYMAHQKSDEALMYLRKQVERLPDRLDLQVLLSDTEVRAGNLDVSPSILQNVLNRLDPKASAELDIPRGAAGGTMYRSSAANPLAESLQVLTGRDLTPKGAAGIHVRLAELFRLRNDHASAIAEWEKSSSLLPRTSWILANLALEQESGGKRLDAMKSYRESLAVFPDTPLVLNNLAFLIAETGGDLFEAMRLARRAETLAPGSVDVLDTQGWIALKQDFLDDATGTFQRVVEKAPGNPEFRKHLAMALIKRNIHSPAIDELVKALDSPPVPGDEGKILALLQSAAMKRP